MIELFHALSFSFYKEQNIAVNDRKAYAKTRPGLPVSFRIGGIYILCFHSPPVYQPINPAFSFVPSRRHSAHSQQSEIADGQRPVIKGKILILKQVGKLGRLLRLENIHVVIHVFCRLLSLSSRWIIVFSTPGFKSRIAQRFVQAH